MSKFVTVVIHCRGCIEVVESSVRTHLDTEMAAGLGCSLQMRIPGTAYYMCTDDTWLPEEIDASSINVTATNFHNTYIEPDGDYPIPYGASICKVNNPGVNSVDLDPESLTDEDIATIYGMIENSKDSMWRVKRAFHLDGVGMRIHEERLKENKS